MGKRGIERSDIRLKMNVVRCAINECESDKGALSAIDTGAVSSKSLELMGCVGSSKSWVRAAIRRLIDSGEIVELVCVQSGRKYLMIRK